MRPHPLGLPCWTRGALGPRPRARARLRGRLCPRSLSRARDPRGGARGGGRRRGPGAACPRRRAGRSRGASPLPTRPPSARCEISCPPARLQRRFEEIRVPTSRGAGPGAGAARGGGPGVDPGLPPRPLRDPPGPGPLASRPPPARCQLQPAAAPRSSPPRPLGPFHLP